VRLLPDHDAKRWRAEKAVCIRVPALAGEQVIASSDESADGGRGRTDDVARRSTRGQAEQLHQPALAHVLESRRDGTRIYYSLSSPIVTTLWRTMRRAAEEHVTDLERLAADYVGDRSKLRTITRDDLRARLRDGDVVVLDVRPEAEYAAGHVRGAISIPIHDLRSRLGEIPDGSEVVAYCRGPYCVYADEAVRILTKKGVTAVRLEDGFPEWADARLPAAKANRQRKFPPDTGLSGARPAREVAGLVATRERLRCVTLSFARPTGLRAGDLAGSLR